MMFKKGDVLHRAPISNKVSITVNGIVITGHDPKKPSDSCERQYRVLEVGNCGRLFLDDLRMPGMNISGCVRFHHPETYTVTYREPEREPLAVWGGVARGQEKEMSW